MTTTFFSTFEERIADQVARAAQKGLSAHPRQLPPWLFYDEVGSRLFEQITRLPEYYLTRTERAILTAHSEQIIALAAGGHPLRIAEIGAGSADKTRLLLAAAIDLQGTVIYEPVDVSASALTVAQQRIEREMPGVTVASHTEDYTASLESDPVSPGERRLVLYIGSSIGNFEPDDAARLLTKIRTALAPGDTLLLGVDMVKEASALLAAYDDAAGVTAAFNRNVLVRLNRELGADFRPQSFAHRAVWNQAASRIEMHLESLTPQTVHLRALDQRLDFATGERIHTENSYKYRPGQAEALLADTGFCTVAAWTDHPAASFRVLLGRAA